MECRAEINRFAIFLFCLLVPLGSMAPTETSESKVTTGERQNRFTTEIPTFALIIQQKAHELFEFYHTCISATFHTEPWNVPSKARDLAERIPQCAAFQASCCALHHIQQALESLRGVIESLCAKSGVLQLNLNQLNTTLRQGTAFYTCRSQQPAQLYPEAQSMDLAERKTFIWWVLKKYDDIMQLTGSLYSEEA